MSRIRYVVRSAACVAMLCMGPSAASVAQAQLSLVDSWPTDGSPLGLAIEPAGTLLITTASSPWLLRYSAAGILLSSMALPHAEDYHGIAVAPSGDIFYTFYHPGIFDLSHVNTNGGAIDGFGGYGASSKYVALSEFYGSCIPSYIPCEGVYVTDPIGNLVVKFESSTSPAYGDSYVQAWSSYHAAGIATIGGQVYVSSSDGGKITKYSPYGTELSSFATGAVNAEGLAAGPNGTLYLADRGVGPGSSRLLVFSTTGALLASVGSTVAGYPYGPAEYVGIAVTGDGTVFAGDYSHSRVLKFSQTPTASKAVTLGQLKALYR